MAAHAIVFARAAELEAAGRPFVVATVVAVRRPTSARPGARGIVHPDGTIEGWVGGSCAQPVVVREALRALADGQPRLLRLSKDGPAEGRRGDGVIELVMTCHSGGTLEIYVEPHLPAPLLWVAGTTPIAGALVAPRRGRGLAGDASSTRSRTPTRSRAPSGSARPTSEASTRTRAPYVVVATQGIWDEEARRPGAPRDASYVGLVASPTRAAVVREWLREETTVGEERLAALRAPAGMDLGAETAEEIALSILAELVQVRRGRADFVASPGPATVAGGATGDRSPVEPVVDDIVLLDPVCGMTVDRGARAPPRRARRHRLRVLLDRLPDAVHQGAGGLPRGATAVLADAGLTDSAALPEASMHFEGSVEIAAPRDRVWAFVIDPNQVGQCGPGVEIDRGHRRHPFQGDGQGRHRVHQRPLRREHGDRRAGRAGAGRRSRPTARRRQRRRRRRRRCACPTATPAGRDGLVRPT